MDANPSKPTSKKYAVTKFNTVKTAYLCRFDAMSLNVEYSASDVEHSASSAEYSATNVECSASSDNDSSFVHERSSLNGDVFALNDEASAINENESSRIFIRRFRVKVFHNSQYLTKQHRSTVCQYPIRI